MLKLDRRILWSLPITVSLYSYPFFYLYNQVDLAYCIGATIWPRGCGLGFAPCCSPRRGHKVRSAVMDDGADAGGTGMYRLRRSARPFA